MAIINKSNYPYVVVEKLIDNIAEEFPEYRVKHYSGEFIDEEELERQLKSNGPTVLVDVESIESIVEQTSSDKRSVKDTIYFDIYCANQRRLRDFTEQHIQAYVMAAQVRAAVSGFVITTTDDPSGNTIHSNGLAYSLGIERAISNEHVSVYLLRAAVQITHDLDYVIT